MGFRGALTSAFRTAFPDRSVPVVAAPRSGMRAFAGGPNGMQTAPYAFPYDAANWSSQEMGEWLPWLRSPDTEITPYRDRMVARQRDLYRNDGWARGAIARILDSTIGTELGCAGRHVRKSVFEATT